MDVLLFLFGLAVGLVILVVYHFKVKHDKALTVEAIARLTSDKRHLVDKVMSAQQTARIQSERLSVLDQIYTDRFDAWKTQAEQDIRADANLRSRAVIRGQATEHLAPYMMAGLNPKDFRFIGDPIDYLICVGASGIHDKTTDHVEEVILLDIKTGKSDLSKVQRRIRDAILEGRVRFMTYNTDTETTRMWPNDS